MFNSFPVPRPDSGGGLPSMLDFSAYQTVYDWTGTTVSVLATSWQTFVNITGQGWLTFVQGFSGANALIPDVRVTIDGVSYVFTGSSSGALSVGNMIYQPIYFKSSLKVEVFNSSASAAIFGCDYTYLLKTGSPNPTKQTVLNSSQRKMVYFTTQSNSITTALDVSGRGYLLSAEFLGSYNTSAPDVKGFVYIDSVSKMEDRTLFSIGSANNKQPLLLGPIRFTSGLTVQTRINGSVNTATAIVKVVYTLD